MKASIEAGRPAPQEKRTVGDGYEELDDRLLLVVVPQRCTKREREKE